MSSTLLGATGLTVAFNSGNFVNGSTPSQFSNSAVINYAINGRFFSRGVIASQPLVIEPNTGIVVQQAQVLQPVPAGRGCTFAIFLDPAGAYTVSQGDIVDAGLNCPVIQAPTGKALVGAIKVNNASAAAFVPGTTSFAVGGGVTTTYINLAQHPGASV